MKITIDQVRIFGKIKEFIVQDFGGMTPD